MLTSAVAAILARDLRTLRREVEAYPDETQLWHVVPGIANPGGTLVLHLTGNLQHFVGACLGASGYLRDRPAEFARRHVPRSELLGEIARAEAIVGVLARLEDGDLRADFPELVAGNRVATGEYLIHLISHFTYHLGQLDYHRRMVVPGPGGVGAVSPTELSTARRAQA
jgi:hypothetical protein